MLEVGQPDAEVSHPPLSAPLKTKHRQATYDGYNMFLFVSATQQIKQIRLSQEAVKRIVTCSLPAHLVNAVIAEFRKWPCRVALLSGRVRLDIVCMLLRSVLLEFLGPESRLRSSCLGGGWGRGSWAPISGVGEPQAQGFSVK